MKILIIKTSSLGDIVQSLSVIPYLKDRYPSAQIDWIVEEPFSQLLINHPDLHRVFRIQTKKWRKFFWKKESRQEISTFLSELRKEDYHLIFDLQGNIKSGLCAWQAKSPIKVGFGCRTVSEWPNLLFSNRKFNPPPGLNIREDYLYLAQMGNSPSSAPLEERQEAVKAPPLKIMICPGSNWENKTLSSSTLIEFLKRIQSHLSCHYLFIWGTPNEKKDLEVIQKEFPETSTLCEKLNLNELKDLMNQMDLVIAMDSLPLHLAGTTRAKTYSIFGASSSNKYKPLGQQHHAFQGACPYNQKFEKRCKLLRSCKTGGCMKNIRGEQLFDHFILWWRSFESFS